MITKTNMTLPSISNLNSKSIFEVDIVLTCQNCGKVVEFTQRDTIRVGTSHNYENLEKGSIFAVTALYSKCCNSISFATYLHRAGTNGYEFISIYPQGNPEEVTNSIKELSPRFAKLYSDSVLALENNASELAGSGFRNAMEVLIKDFSIKHLGENENTVNKKKLVEAIDDYLPTFDLRQAADGVRLLGNDYTHYERKYDQYDIEALHRFLKLFMQLIDTNLLLSEIVPRKDLS